MSTTEYRDRLFTATGLAKHWGVSDTHIYLLLRSGQLKGFRLGDKLWRVRLSDVVAYEDAAMAQAVALTAANNPPVHDSISTFRHERDSTFRLARMVAAS